MSNIEVNPFTLSSDFKIDPNEKGISFYRNPKWRDVMMQLTGMSLKLFVYIGSLLEWNHDRVMLTGDVITDFMKESDITSKTTVYNAIKELLRCGFLTRGIKRGEYWVNTKVMFYGDKRQKQVISNPIVANQMKKRRKRKSRPEPKPEQTNDWDSILQELPDE